MGLLVNDVRKKIKMIDRNNPRVPIVRQAELLSISRSSVYYKKRIKEDDEKYKKLITEIHEKYIFYGVRKISQELRRKGYKINRKRVWRLMKEMGIKAVYPKPRTTFSDKKHEKYPYLLRGVEINKKNQVWSSDITYIKIKEGWIYLGSSNEQICNILGDLNNTRRKFLYKSTRESSKNRNS